MSRDDDRNRPTGKPTQTPEPFADEAPGTSGARSGGSSTAEPDAPTSGKAPLESASPEAATPKPPTSKNPLSDNNPLSEDAASDTAGLEAGSRRARAEERLDEEVGAAAARPGRPRRRRNLPEPPHDEWETRLARLRRRFRRRVLRTYDQAINGLYSAISWLDQRAPVEQRYYRVAIFGSSRIQPEDDTYKRVCKLARDLSYMGCDIVTGGGPGLMTAANEGARRGAYRFHTRSFGLAILLPMEEQPNPFLDEVAHHKTFFSRLHQFIRMSHAYVVVDGGIGTTLEALMVWQLLQVGLLQARPLVFVGPMWLGLREWIRDDVIGPGLASARDLELVHWVASEEEALEIVRRDRQRFVARHEVRLPPPSPAPEVEEEPC